MVRLSSPASLPWTALAQVAPRRQELVLWQGPSKPIRFLSSVVSDYTANSSLSLNAFVSHFKHQ